jgi:F-type H+-transporting ATPase subunit 8
MPQLNHIFFINQISYGFLILFVLLYVASKYILPYFAQLQLIRVSLVEF